MLGGLKQTLCAPGPRDPKETDPELSMMSPMEVWVSSGLPPGQGLLVQHTWEWHKLFWRRSPLTPTSVQFSSVAQLCPTLCDSMNHSTPGLPVHHQLPEFTQTHVPRVSDVIQPSHPLSSPSPPAPNPSQHQGPFQ